VEDPRAETMIKKDQQKKIQVEEALSKCQMTDSLRRGKAKREESIRLVMSVFCLEVGRS
jgi:hypothetical protein